MYYNVIVREIEIYEVNIEAENEKDAIEQAREKLEDKNGKGLYHRDSERESEIYEVDGK